jgi:hypothetical protein
MLNVEVYRTPCGLYSFERCTIICEDPPGNAESKDYARQELDCCLLCDIYYWHCPYPLGECVNCDKEKLVSSRCPGLHSHSSDCEWSREINWPKRIDMLYSLLLEDLTIHTLGYYFHRVILSRRPLEYMPKCFVDDRTS